MRPWTVAPVLALVLAVQASAAHAPAPTQPKQPEKGPGSTEYAHKEVVKSDHGAGDTQYWIFEPAQPKPAGKIPLIVFMHGWAAMEPDGYLGWIEHMVKRGNIVLYPRYQATALTPVEKFTDHAFIAIKNAIMELKNDIHVQADLDKLATIGHSYGGVLSANLAALAKKNELPAFKAVMCVQPGTNGFDGWGKVYADYAEIPADTLLLTVAGDRDIVVRDVDSKRIFKAASTVRTENKDYILVRTDEHGAPKLEAHHLAPAAAGALIDAQDFYGYWKWFDGLTDAAFFKKNREYALGNTDKQRFMGKWSDGKPVVEPLVTKDPESLKAEKPDQAEARQDRGEQRAERRER